MEPIISISRGLSSTSSAKVANGQAEYELHFFATERARRLFYHLRYIGEARPRPGFRHENRDVKGFLLHFVLSGQMWFRVRRNVHLVRSNGCCLLDVTEPVQYGNDGPGRAHLLWMHFDGVLMPHVFRELGADTDPVFNDVARHHMIEIFRELLRIAAGQSGDDEPTASALLSAMIAILFARRSATLQHSDFGIDPQHLSKPIREALTMMARYYHQPKNIKSISAEIGLSRFHFSRLFRRETGFTPAHYLNVYRLEAARNLLSSTDKPIAHVARAVGIPNAENFSKLFRRRHGLSPRAYRDKLRSAKPNAAR